MGVFRTLATDAHRRKRLRAQKSLRLAPDRRDVERDWHTGSPCPDCVCREIIGPGMRARIALLVTTVPFGALVLFIAAGAGVGPASASPLTDPPRIVGWHLIGNAGIGMSRERINYAYGFGDNPPVAGMSPVVSYRLHGGWLKVAYASGRVTSLATTSPYYRTKDGAGAGTRIPLGPCHRTKANPCERRWRGFVLGLDLGFWWIRRVSWSGRKLTVCLNVERGIVKEIQILTFGRPFSPGYAGCH